MLHKCLFKLHNADHSIKVVSKEVVNYRTEGFYDAF